MASGWGVVNELVVVKDKGALMDNYRGGWATNGGGVDDVCGCATW